MLDLSRWLREWESGFWFLPLLDSIRNILYALNLLVSEGVDGIDVFGKDLLEEVEVFAVQGEAVAGDGVLD